MSQTPWGSHAARVEAARRGFEELDDKRSATVLDIQCDRGHHVAKVYRTSVGLVYVAARRSRSHGRRDLPDTGHDAGRIDQWVDLLEDLETVDAPDALPAWCDCGRRNLQPAAVVEWVGQGERRVVIGK